MISGRAIIQYRFRLILEQCVGRFIQRGSGVKSCKTSRSLHQEREEKAETDMRDIKKPNVDKIRGFITYLYE